MLTLGLLHQLCNQYIVLRILACIFSCIQDSQIAADRLLYLPASQSVACCNIALAASRIALPILPGGHWPQPSVATWLPPLFKPKVPLGHNDGHANVIRFAPTMSPYLPLWHCSHSPCPYYGVEHSRSAVHASYEWICLSL